MLRLVAGRMGSGKTTLVYNKIKELAEKGESAVLIVPEQYSFHTEKTMLEMLGAKGADSVEVLSFSFLAQKLLKKYGVNSKPAIDDSTRALMMSLALESISDDLKIYGRHRYSASVISEMLKIIKEFRQCSVSADMLRETAHEMNDSLLKSKLGELALVSDAYTALVETSYFDDECALDRLCDVLDTHGDFSGRTVFLDGFRGYTSQELKVLERIMSQAEDVYITLTSDRSFSCDDFSAFAHTRRTRQKLVQIAEKNSVKIAPVEFAELPDEKRYNSKELNLLEKSLYESRYDTYENETESITLCSAEDFESECEYVAHTVKKLIRTENIRCRDIAVISRSENNYARQIRSALIKNGVPVFEDKRQPVITQPLIEFILSSVDIAVSGFSCDSVMRVLKTGLTDLGTEEISELENYALMWQINGTKWLGDWTAHPDGLGEKMHGEDELRLKAINRSRLKAVAPLQKLRAVLKECSGLEAAKAIYSLLVEMNVPENLRKLSESLNKRGEYELAEEQGRIWDVVIEIIDRIALALENIRLAPKRFAELLNLIVSMYTVGNLPQGLDEIVIGSADRVKTSSPKVVFAVGVNDGVFPMVPVSTGILSDSERKVLADYSLNMDDNFEQKMMEEHFIAYSTLCSPMDRLYVTYLRKDITGAQMSHSELVTQLRRIFPKIKTVDTVMTDNMDFVEGEEPAFELMARLYQQGGVMYKTLEKYFSSRPEYKGRLEALKRAVKKEEFEITDKDIAVKLFGRDMYMSASRTEVYHKCPFEYFCRYGLKAEPRKTAELDPMQKGTAIHFILENLISAYGSDGLCKMEKPVRDKCVLDILEEYFTENLAVNAEMGERFDYLFRQLGTVVCEVVDRLVAEFSVSEFKPVAFELKIDDDGEVPAYEIELPDGGVLRLKGSVDRVDVMESGDGDYVRVVDYKSGGKEFDLNEVFYGLNMQMLIYLFAIWKSGFREYRDVKPAGILYMPVNAPFAKAERGEEENTIAEKKQKAARMKGMVLDDSRIVYSMDSRGAGEIIPAKFKKDDTCSGNLISLKRMGLLMKRVEKILADMATEIHNGVIHVNPARAEKTASAYHNVCEYCDYKDVCGVDEDTPRREIAKAKFEDSVNALGGEEDA